MNDKPAPVRAEPVEDPKVVADWAAVEARRADLNRRDGGDFRRQVILKRLGLLKGLRF